MFKLRTLVIKYVSRFKVVRTPVAILEQSSKKDPDLIVDRYEVQVNFRGTLVPRHF